MGELYETLEKMVRDVEKGALRVDSKVMIDAKIYDAKCYRIRSVNPSKPDVIRIDLREGKGYDEA